MTSRYKNAPGVRQGAVSTSTSTGVAMALDGIQVISSTSAPVQNLAQPFQYREQGNRKTIIKTTTSSALAQVVVQSTMAGCSTAVFIANAATTLTFTAVSQAVEILATSATQWEIVSNVGSVDCS